MILSFLTVTLLPFFLFPSITPYTSFSLLLFLFLSHFISFSSIILTLTPFLNNSITVNVIITINFIITINIIITFNIIIIIFRAIQALEWGWDLVLGPRVRPSHPLQAQPQVRYADIMCTYSHTQTLFFHNMNRTHWHCTYSPTHPPSPASLFYFAFTLIINPTLTFIFFQFCAINTQHTHYCNVRFVCMRVWVYVCA